MNAYLDQMNRMSDTLRTGIGAIARDRLNKATLGLEEKKLDYGLARDEREWNDPTKVVAREEAQGKLSAINQKKNTNLTPDHVFGTNQYRLTHAGTPTKTGKSMNDNVSARMGTVFDPEKRGYRRPDGSYVSLYEFETQFRDPVLREVIQPMIDPMKARLMKRDEYLDQADAGEGSPEEQQAYFKAFEQYENDPKLQLQDYLHYRAQLEGIDGDVAQYHRDRADAEIARLRGVITDADKTAYQRQQDERNYQLKLREAQASIAKANRENTSGVYTRKDLEKYREDLIKQKANLTAKVNVYDFGAKTDQAVQAIDTELARVDAALGNVPMQAQAPQLLDSNDPLGLRSRGIGGGGTAMAARQR